MAERVADLSELRYRHSRAHLARECDCTLWYVPTAVAVRNTESHHRHYIKNKQASQ